MASEEVACVWRCGRGLFGGGGVLGCMMSVLGKASSGWPTRLSMEDSGGRDSFACPPIPAPPTKPSSLVQSTLEQLRSSFSEELVIVAESCKKREKEWGAKGLGMGGGSKRKRKHVVFYFRVF